MAVLELCGLKKGFVPPDGTQSVPVVDIAEFRLEAGEQVALSGSSGSGKTTLLNLIAGILSADTGTIRIGGSEMTALGEAKRDRLRAGSIGYIFQTFNLLQGFTCLENVLLGMSFGPGADPVLAETLLRRVGLGERLAYFPRQLSTGQQQRVAVARAVANRPKLVLADEPTGNLDPANARQALALIREICTESNAALLLVSHDPAVLASFSRVVPLAELNRAAWKEAA
jgi:ABC-type lipoprotein export system ATPase subunit